MRFSAKKWIKASIFTLAFSILFLSCGCTREIEDINIPAAIEENTVAEQEAILAAISDAYTTTEPPTLPADQRREGKLTEADLPEDARIVYLTFDDGPSGNTRRIMDILDEYNCDATFFVINAGGYNYLYKEIVDRGFTIALHTYTHDYAAVYSSEDAYFYDLQRISDEVFAQTGLRPNLMRFPGGSSNTISARYNAGIMTRLADAVEERGYIYFDWNSTNGDASAEERTVDQLIASATATYQERIVMLMHDNDYHDNTVAALPYIIEHYKNLGYYFLALNSNSPTAHHPIYN